MLEQTKRNGCVYNVQPLEKSVSSKPAKVSEFTFGPYRLISVYQIDDYDMWVQDEMHGDWYHYKGDTYPLPLVGREEVHSESTPGCSYLYGVAEGEEGIIPYFVQDTPYVRKQIIPDINAMEMPFSMRTLDYGRVFSYPQGLKELLKGCPLAYGDRFKRPVIRSQGHTYPISLAKQSFSWDELPDSTYPVVADLSNTHYAVLDLEPNHTKEEELVYESIMGYYEENTIRGGRHRLVRLDDSTFKFRYGKGLELIANGMITFYGINGVMLSPNPPPMQTKGFAPVGHVARTINPSDEPEEIKLLIEKLEAYTGDLYFTKMQIREKHKLNTDNSNREFNMLLDLYREVLAPYRSKLPEQSLPWVLAACAKDMIDPREKHATQRSGMPYLVYLSAIICDKKDGAVIWKPDLQQNL